MTKVSFEVAQNDFNKWAEARRIGEKKREGNLGSEETILEAITDGDLVINEDNTMELKLVWPIIGDGDGVKSLDFKFRLTAGERQEAMKGISANDGEGRLIGLIAQLTNQPKGIIKKLESAPDFDRATSIAVYFL